MIFKKYFYFSLTLISLSLLLTSRNQKSNNKQIRLSNLRTKEKISKTNFYVFSWTFYENFLNVFFFKHFFWSLIYLFFSNLCVSFYFHIILLFHLWGNVWRNWRLLKTTSTAWLPTITLHYSFQPFLIVFWRLFDFLNFIFLALFLSSYFWSMKIFIIIFFNFPEFFLGFHSFAIN